MPRSAALLAAAGAAVLVGALVVGGCGGGEAPTQAAHARPAGFPTPTSVGVPAGWQPKKTLAGDLVVKKEGAVVQDILLTGGNLVIDAPNVTVKRVKLQGGRIVNVPDAACRNGLLVEDSTFEPPPGQTRSRMSDSEGVAGVGGYTARRVKVWNRAEGLRDGGRSSGCGPVRIEDSFVRIASPRGCGDWHGDGIQGFDGPPLTVRNVTIELVEDLCGGTAPFFVPDRQGNTTVRVNRLLVMGGGATFRLGVPGSVRHLSIVDRTWSYVPVDVRCDLLSAWDARLVRITRQFRVARSVRAQRCG
jgi:hypothetical protein